MRRDARAFRFRRFRSNCAPERHRSDPPKMARLRIAPSSARTFRLSNDARDCRASKRARTLVRIAVVEPVHHSHDTAQMFVVGGERRQPFGNELAAPPAFFAERREAITIE